LKLGSGVFDDPVFSPDGEKLAFTRRDNANALKQLFVANADGSDMARVGSFDTDVSDPTWSPDSALIALTRGGNGSKIVIVDAATGAEVDEFGVDGATNGQADWR
jgi:Tol biopolymer transport system component